MKRLFCLLLLVVVMLTLFTGCTTGEKISSISEEIKAEATKNSLSETFVLVYGNKHVDTYFYYRDTVTDVMYVVKDGTQEAGLTVMLDPNTGLPLTYTNWLEYKEEL